MMYIFVMLGKRCATPLIPQLVSYPGSYLGSTKLGSRLRNEPLVCPSVTEDCLLSCVV